MTRTDLLALTRDDLVALANRGLVKRAAKEVDAGAGPDIECEADGSVAGRFGDGVTTRLPAGAGLAAAECDCAASGRCRHQIAVILAYQNRYGAGETEDGDGGAESGADGETADWSFDSVSDERLRRLFGDAAEAGARRLFDAGYTARVHRPTGDDPQLRVELPACTVRFLVPSEPGYVRSDAAEATHAEAVVLAVWAVRAAAEREPAGTDVAVTVGGTRRTAEAGTGLEPVLELLSAVLRDGVANSPPTLVSSLRQAGRRLGGRGLHWPAAALAELADQLDAHAARHAAHQPRQLAALITELHARHRAANGDRASRAHVLGGREPAFTPLRQVRLTGLGCRVDDSGGQRTAEVYLALPDTGIVLTSRHSWPITGEAPPTVAAIARTRVAGITLERLAVGDLVTAAAERTAGRTVRLSADRLAKPVPTPADGRWEQLPEPILVTDVDKLRVTLSRLPPGLVRPRVGAEFVRVVPIASVEHLGYHPGDQRLRAVIRHPGGAELTVTARHRACAPAALDRLAAALAGEHGEPRFLCGSTGRAASALEWEPIAVRTSTGVVVPDLAAGDGNADLAPDVDTDADPVTAALDEALTGCAELAHGGLAGPAPSARRRLEAAGWELRRIGLVRAADCVSRLVERLGADDTSAVAEAWVDAQLRLLTTAELR